MLFSARTAPLRRLPCTDNTAECSLRPGRLFSGLPILSGYVMVPVQFLYRDHNFLTQITDTFMDSAICALVILPSLFFLIIQFTFDSSNFLMVPPRCFPIGLHRSVRCSHLRIFISTLSPKPVMTGSFHGM